MTDQAETPVVAPETPAVAPETPVVAPEAQVAAPTGAPESYEVFTLPEGATLEGDDLTGVQSFAKELNLTQEQAQKIVDREFAQQAKVTAQVEATRTEWETASKSDPEFGGEKFDENLAIAKSALDTFGDDDLKGLLDITGRGSHPAVIRAFYKVGKAISEDNLVKGEGAPPEQKSFYPNSNHVR